MLSKLECLGPNRRMGGRVERVVGGERREERCCRRAGTGSGAPEGPAQPRLSPRGSRQTAVPAFSGCEEAEGSSQNTPGTEGPRAGLPPTNERAGGDWLVPQGHSLAGDHGLGLFLCMGFCVVVCFCF